MSRRAVPKANTGALRAKAAMNLRRAAPKANTGALRAEAAE